MTRSVAIVAADPTWEAPIAALLADLRASGDEQWFHPFPLDEASARSIASDASSDIYLLAVEDGEALALGMLRGWDEGYETPSLGLAVRSTARRRGIGRAMMLRLQDEARQAGSRRVRLTVERTNTGAVELYASLGYAISDDHGDRLIGFLELDGS